ncbi:hypothetical protein CI610_01773 [invertebrate metagenome]|uniref:Uncharacterized protein n=1 Tax=invertebrate metagenome TaxID=1711999 RepID=A0A2H9T7Q8_9ZZZZ
MIDRETLYDTFKYIVTNPKHRQIIEALSSPDTTKESISGLFLRQVFDDRITHNYRDTIPKPPESVLEKRLQATCCYLREIRNIVKQTYPNRRWQFVFAFDGLTKETLPCLSKHFIQNLDDNYYTSASIDASGQIGFTAHALEYIKNDIQFFEDTLWNTPLSGLVNLLVFDPCLAEKDSPVIAQLDSQNDTNTRSIIALPISANDNLWLMHTGLSVINEANSYALQSLMRTIRPSIDQPEQTDHTEHRSWKEYFNISRRNENPKPSLAEEMGVSIRKKPRTEINITDSSNTLFMVTGRLNKVKETEQGIHTVLQEFIHNLQTDTDNLCTEVLSDDSLSYQQYGLLIDRGSILGGLLLPFGAEYRQKELTELCSDFFQELQSCLPYISSNNCYQLRISQFKQPVSQGETFVVYGASDTGKTWTLNRVIKASGLHTLYVDRRYKNDHWNNHCASSEARKELFKTVAEKIASKDIQIVLVDELDTDMEPEEAKAAMNSLKTTVKQHQKIMGFVSHNRETIDIIKPEYQLCTGEEKQQLSPAQSAAIKITSCDTINPHKDCLFFMPQGSTFVRQSQFSRLSVTSQTDIVIHPKQIIRIQGSAGCGKTTLLQLIGGLDMEQTFRLTQSPERSKTSESCSWFSPADSLRKYQDNVVSIQVFYPLPIPHRY